MQYTGFGLVDRDMRNTTKVFLPVFFRKTPFTVPTVSL
jgi:hypothetical protein